MKETRASFALLFFIIAAHIAHLLPQGSSIKEITQSYAATICPGSVSEARATALLPNKSVPLRDVIRPNAELRRNAQGNYLLNNGAILIEGNPLNTIEIQSRTSRWTAALTCDTSNNSSWFVGGTANVTSQSKLILVNSGLSDAIVDVTSYSESGPTATVPITVKPSSEKIVRVDGFDPGANRVVLQVETRSGRVTSYMLDERVRGLNNLGGDFVAPIAKPATELVIAGLPVQYGGSSKAKHSIRIMTVGKVEASASVEVISPEGVFIPVGYGNISLNPQEVRDLDISDLDLGNKTFGLKIISSEPVVAGVFTEARTGSISDFMWSSPAPIFGTASFNLYGLEPTVTFIGEKILVDVSWRNNRGRQFNKTLIGDEVLNWKVPDSVRLITFSNRSGVRAAMNWISRDGVTNLAFRQSADLESATKPIADIAVIQSRK